MDAVVLTNEIICDGYVFIRGSM